MSQPSQDRDVISLVTARIDLAIDQNRRQEWIIYAVLVILLIVGLGLIVGGALSGNWWFLAPGTILQLLVVLPIRRLIELRADNLRLQILPELLRLASTAEAKRLAASLVKQLINKI